MDRMDTHFGLSRRLTQAVVCAIALSAIIAPPPLSVAQENTEIGYASPVIGSVYSGNHSARIQTKDRVTFEQRIRTEFGAATTLEFHDKTRISIGASAELILDELIYNPKNHKSTAW